jgi:nicotinamidase-related amidase
VIEILLPGDDDYFVPQLTRSGFFSTLLDTLLEYLRVKTLILTR